MAIMDTPPPGRSRVEEEIIEILERADRPPTVIDQVRGHAALGQASVRHSLQRGVHVSWSPRAAIATAFLLALAALVVRGPVPVLAAILAVLSFAALVSLWFVRSVTPPPSGPKWRGQDMRGSSPVDQWLSRRNLPRE
jgi:hypothetical protein